jgi:CHAD domain-containing protein
MDYLVEIDKEIKRITVAKLNIMDRGQTGSKKVLFHRGRIEILNKIRPIVETLQQDLIDIQQNIECQKVQIETLKKFRDCLLELHEDDCPAELLNQCEKSEEWCEKNCTPSDPSEKCWAYFLEV